MQKFSSVFQFFQFCFCFLSTSFRCFFIFLELNFFFFQKLNICPCVRNLRSQTFILCCQIFFFLFQFLHFLLTLFLFEIVNIQMLFMCTFLLPFNSMLLCDFRQYFLFMVYPLIQFCIMLISALKSKTFQCLFQ